MLKCDAEKIKWALLVLFFVFINFFDCGITKYFCHVSKVLVCSFELTAFFKLFTEIFFVLHYCLTDFVELPQKRKEVNVETFESDRCCTPP